MKKIIFIFAFCAAIVVAGQSKQDGFKFNAVYDCVKDKARNFKVLNCNGSGVCKVFIFNEYNPNGGVESEMSKDLIKETISRYKCVVQGGVETDETQEKPEEQETPKEESPQPKNDEKAVACPVSDPDSNGKTALEKSFRGAIRETWEREAEPGLDGAVTISFQFFNVGAAHKYRVYVDPNDSVGKMIYAVRATFTTCTDYNRRIEKVSRTREFSCYKNTAGKNVCTIIAAPNTNVKDKTESIDKPFNQ